ncbi:MAG: DUF3999 domain-containing protein [Campylobacteraceae bacterium]|jgi:hypothetical protein|nr:DUF3999 domain-containing protein [Campylobacteraceae bacterium]
MYKTLFFAFAFFFNFSFAQSSYDYAYGLELEVQSRSAFSKINIPDEVYRQSLSPSLDDVAVFNKNDQVVAFSFVDVKKTEDIMQEIPMTLYSVSEKISNSTDGSTIYTYTYFMESQNKTEYPSFFKLDWEKADYNWKAKAYVEAQVSDHHNVTAAKGVLLAELKDVLNESSLKADEIATDDYSYYDIKVWHLAITSDVQIPKIKSIKGYIKNQFIDQSFVALDTVHEGQINDTATYKLPSVQPVESIFVDLKQKNLILPLTLFYKNDKDRWIKFDGRIVNEKAKIDFQKTVFAKEFMLKTNGGFGDIPQLTAYRKRVDIIFNSANNAPFILTYGSFRANALDLPASDFLKDADIYHIPTAYTGNFVKLGGEKALKAKIEKEGGLIPKWAIWVVLVFGVAFLIFLAYRLSKELKLNG